MFRIFNANIKPLIVGNIHSQKSNSLNKIISSQYNQVATSNKYDYSTNFHLSKNDQDQQHNDKNQMNQESNQRKKQNLTSTKPFHISSKTECLNLLKNSSDKLLQTLDTFKWIKIAPQINFQVKNHIDHPVLNDFKSRIFKNSPKFKEMINYLDKNFNDFTCKEKAIAFKILATINQLSQSYHNDTLLNLLVKYETDYYDNIDKCDLVDFNNYTDAFCLLRESNIYFLSKTADPVYQLSKDFVESKALKNTDLKSNPSTPAATLTREERINNTIIDDILKKWYLDYQLNNNLLLITKLANKLRFTHGEDKNKFFYQLISNNYDSLSQEKTQVIAEILIHYDDQSRYLKLSRSSRELYFQLFNANIVKMIENLNKFDDPLIRFKLIKYFIGKCKSIFSNEDSIKYKTSLLHYLVHNQSISQMKNAFDYTRLINSISRLIDSLNEKNSKIANMSNFNCSVYSKAYKSLVDSFSVQEEDQQSFEKSEKNLKLNKNEQNNLINQFQKVKETFDLHSLVLLARSTAKAKELKGLHNLALEYLIEASEKCYSKLQDRKLKAQINEILLNSFRYRVINYLPDNILESACHDHLGVENARDFDPEYRRQSALAISLLLVNPEFISKHNLHNMIFNRIYDLLKTSTFVDISPILDSIKIQIHYYKKNHFDKLIQVLNSIHTNIIQQIQNIDLNAYFDKDDLKNYMNVASDLSTLKNQLAWEQNESSMSILDHNKLKTELDGLFQEIDKLDMGEIKNKQLAEQKLFTALAKYKLLSFYVILSNIYDKDYLLAIASNHVKLLGKAEELDLLDEQYILLKTRNHLSTKSIADLLTLSGLFNYFDYRYIIEDNKFKTEFEDILSKLKHYNKKYFKLLEIAGDRKEDTFDKLTLIEYNLCLFHLNIENNDSINYLFNVFKSLEDLKKEFAHLNDVLIYFFKIFYFFLLNYSYLF